LSFPEAGTYGSAQNCRRDYQLPWSTEQKPGHAASSFETLCPNHCPQGKDRLKGPFSEARVSGSEGDKIVSRQRDINYDEPRADPASQGLSNSRTSASQSRACEKRVLARMKVGTYRRKLLIMHLNNGTKNKQNDWQDGQNQYNSQQYEYFNVNGITVSAINTVEGGQCCRHL